MRAMLPLAVMKVLLAAATLPGCGEASSTYTGPLIPVKGKVTYKGQPLINGTISFEPEDAGREVSGNIGPDGTYVMSTFKEGDGIAPALYRIGITGKPKGGKAIPPKYRNGSSSKLEADVSGEKTEFNFDLK